MRLPGAVCISYCSPIALGLTIDWPKASPNSKALRDNNMERARAVLGLDQARREAVQLVEHRFTELPLHILAFVMIPLLVGPFLWELSPEEEATFTALDIFIWVTFATVLTLKAFLAPHSLQYLRQHWLEVLIVIVPFFRALRILRVLLLTTRTFTGFRRAANADYLIVYALGLVMTAATVVLTLEQDVQGGNITTFPDASWWAIVTVNTVGYGDVVPGTPVGRGIAFVLMLVGIAFLSGITANLASAFVVSGRITDTTLSQLVLEVRSLREEIAGLRADQPGQSQDTGR